MQNYFKTVEKVKPTASAGVTREVFYLSYGWKLNKPPEKEVTKDILKETVEKAYASGAKCKVLHSRPRY